jgi:hypothetical protein
MQHVARWFLESVNLHLGERHDPEIVARRWGFRVRVRQSGSAVGLCIYDTIWIDRDLPEADRRRVVAHELAFLALLMRGEDGDPEALAGTIFGA